MKHSLNTEEEGRVQFQQYLFLEAKRLEEKAERTSKKLQYTEESKLREQLLKAITSLQTASAPYFEQYMKYTFKHNMKRI